MNEEKINDNALFHFLFSAMQKQPERSITNKCWNTKYGSIVDWIYIYISKSFDSCDHRKSSFIPRSYCSRLPYPKWCVYALSLNISFGLFITHYTLYGFFPSLLCNIQPETALWLVDIYIFYYTTIAAYTIRLGALLFVPSSSGHI